MSQYRIECMKHQYVNVCLPVIAFALDLMPTCKYAQQQADKQHLDLYNAGFCLCILSFVNTHLLLLAG